MEFEDKQEELNSTEMRAMEQLAGSQNSCKNRKRRRSNNKMLKGVFDAMDGDDTE